MSGWCWMVCKRCPYHNKTEISFGIPSIYLLFTRARGNLISIGTFLFLYILLNTKRTTTWTCCHPPPPHRLHTRRDWIDDDSFACPTDRRDGIRMFCGKFGFNTQIDIRAGHDLCCPHKHILKICKTFTLSFGESFLIYLLVSGSPLLLHYSIVVVHGHHPSLVPLLGWMMSLCKALPCPVHGSNVKAERARNFIRIVTTNIYWQTRNLFFCCTWTGSFGQDRTGQQQKHQQH